MAVKAFLLAVGLVVVGIGLFDGATKLRVHDGPSSGVDCGSVFHAKLDEAVHEDAVNAATRPGGSHIYDACQDTLEKQKVVLGVFVGVGATMMVGGLAIRRPRKRPVPRR